MYICLSHYNISYKYIHELFRGPHCVLPTTLEIFNDEE